MFLLLLVLLRSASSGIASSICAAAKCMSVFSVGFLWILFVVDGGDLCAPHSFSVIIFNKNQFEMEILRFKCG